MACDKYGFDVCFLLSFLQALFCPCLMPRIRSDFRSSIPQVGVQLLRSCHYRSLHSRSLWLFISFVLIGFISSSPVGIPACIFVEISSLRNGFPKTIFFSMFLWLDELRISFAFSTCKFCVLAGSLYSLEFWRRYWVLVEYHHQYLFFQLSSLCLLLRGLEMASNPFASIHSSTKTSLPEARFFLIRFQRSISHPTIKRFIGIG